MNTDDFHTLYEYNSWANRRILDACGSLTSEQFAQDLRCSFPSIRDTLAHIVGAEWIWYERFHGRHPKSFPPVASYTDVAAVRRRWMEVERDLLDYVASLSSEDLQHVAHFKTMAGIEMSQPIWQCLQHVANHSTYHRGQITAMLRQLGAKPLGTDLIGFYRERAARTNA